MYLITIDGASGSGKSTVAARVASELGILYFDSDMLTNAIALCCIQKNVNSTSIEDINLMLQENTFSLKIGQFGNLCALWNQKDITNQLKHPLVSTNAYNLSKLKCVRDYVTIEQFKMSKQQTLVIDGINSSKYFPSAKYKFFLTCNAETRAQRKYDSALARGIKNVTYERILEETYDADQSGFIGENSGVKIGDDTQVIDTTFKSSAEAAKEIVEIVKAGL